MQGYNSSRGQATVEFALVLLVLAGLLYGILEVSRLIFINSEVQNAAREATHYAALHPGVSGSYLKTNVVGPRLTLISPSSPDLHVSDPCFLIVSPPCSSDEGDGPFYPIQVTVTYSWSSLVNFVPDMSTLSLKPLGPLTLTGKSTELIEAP